MTLCVYLAIELSTSLELSDLLGCDCDLLACGGVDAFTGGALCNGKGAKAYELNFLTCYQCILNSLKGSVKSQFSICVGKICLLGNLLY